MGARSDFLVSPEGSKTEIWASKKSTWGDSWFTSKDNQNFKIYMYNKETGNVKEAYITQAEAKKLKELEAKGYKIQAYDNNNSYTIYMGSGAGSEDLPGASGAAKVPTMIAKKVGEAGERNVVKYIGRQDRIIDDAFKEAGR